MKKGEKCGQKTVKGNCTKCLKNNDKPRKG